MRFKFSVFDALCNRILQGLLLGLVSGIMQWSLAVSHVEGRSLSLFLFSRCRVNQILQVHHLLLP